MTQVEYIAILLINCGLTGAGGRAWLSAEFGRKYADELTSDQKHEAIERLKLIKQNLRQRVEDGDDFKYYLAHDD